MIREMGILAVLDELEVPLCNGRTVRAGLARVPVCMPCERAVRRALRPER